MNDTPKTEPAETPPRVLTRDEQFVQHLLMLRTTNPTARSALRRGDSSALADRALPYLARWNFHPDELAAALLFSAALCRYVDIRHVGGISLGGAAYRSTGKDTRDPIDTNAGRRVVAAQRQTLKIAHRTFAGPFSALNDQHGAVDWLSVWRTYKRWDHADTAKQRECRRSVLLGFFNTKSSADDTAAADA